MLVYTSIKLFNGGRSPPYGKHEWRMCGGMGSKIKMSKGGIGIKLRGKLW